MPLTDFQSKISFLLSQNRTCDSYLAGGAALHFKPNSIRYSLDLDYFHDSEQRVASAFTADRDLLKKNGFECIIEMNQPGYIRSLIKKENDTTKVEWAHDSSWRFMPTQFNTQLGYYLHPVDLAINKVLALAGRDEPRDYLDVHYSFDTILPLGALCWAACGKDPGFNPLSLLELLKRRGKYRIEDFNRLRLNIEIDLQKLKKKWLAILTETEKFINAAPAEEVGCLYYSPKIKKFIEPKSVDQFKETIIHYGSPGGILPRIKS